MASYHLRVELKGKSMDAETYDRLHEVLEVHNFFRIIQADDGGWYRLPHATYHGYSAKETSELRDYLKPIIQSVWSNSIFIVIPSNEASWFLPENKS